MQHEDALPLLFTEVTEPGSVVAAVTSRTPELQLEYARKNGIYEQYVGYMSECYLAGVPVSPVDALRYVEEANPDDNPLCLSREDMLALAKVIERPKLRLVA